MDLYSSSENGTSKRFTNLPKVYVNDRTGIWIQTYRSPKHVLFLYTKDIRNLSVPETTTADFYWQKINTFLKRRQIIPAKVTDKINS